MRIESLLRQAQQRYHHHVKEQHRTPLAILLSLILVWTIALNGPSYSTVTSTVSTYVPSITVDFHPGAPLLTKELNKKKLALLIEIYPKPWLVSLLAHNIQLLPPDWRFMFVGSEASIHQIERSKVGQKFIEQGKLQVKHTPISYDSSTESDEHASRLLSNITFYNKFVKPAEHLFVFNANSILCSSSNKTLDDYLDYDWISAPGLLQGRYRGNGGISLRRVSQVRKILRKTQRAEHDPEALFFFDQFQQLPSATHVATDEEARHFVLEGEFVEEPFAIHLPHAGIHLTPSVWDPVEQRTKIFKWCVDVRMIMPMKFEREKC